MFHHTRFFVCLFHCWGLNPELCAMQTHFSAFLKEERNQEKINWLGNSPWLSDSVNEILCSCQGFSVSSTAWWVCQGVCPSFLCPCFPGPVLDFLQDADSTGPEGIWDNGYRRTEMLGIGEEEKTEHLKSPGSFTSSIDHHPYWHVNLD